MTTITSVLISDSSGHEVPPDTYLVIEEQVTGPLMADAIRAFITGGRATPLTLAWHPALEDWAPIGSLPELAWVFERPVELRDGEQPRLAGFAPRLAAGAMDSVAWLAASFVIGVPIEACLNLIDGLSQPIFGPRFNLLAQIVGALYFVLPMSRLGGGATPGYRLLGLRLVDRKELRPPSIIRAVLWYVVSFARLVGWITYFFDTRHRMLHNLASDTLVIVDRWRKR